MKRTIDDIGDQALAYMEAGGRLELRLRGRTVGLSRSRMLDLRAAARGRRTSGGVSKAKARELLRGLDQLVSHVLAVETDCGALACSECATGEPRVVRVRQPWTCCRCDAALPLATGAQQ